MLKRLNWFRRRRLSRDLLAAVSEGDTQRAERLLDAGASANARDRRSTALSIAGRSHQANGATVRLLLERGAVVNGDLKRTTENPLVFASHSSDEERIRLLITHGADVNALQPGMGTGFTPLQELVRWADLETLTLLIGYGADTNKRSIVSGKTALHMAAYAGRSSVVRLLLDSGADPLLRDVQGQSALDFARGMLNSSSLRDTKHEDGTQALRETIALLEKETEQCPNH